MNLDFDFYVIEEQCGCIYFQTHNDSDTMPILYQKYSKPCLVHRVDGSSAMLCTEEISAILAKKNDSKIKHYESMIAYLRTISQHLS